MEHPRASGASGLQGILSPNPVVVDRDATLDQALALLSSYGFRHLPVVECNRVVGILSDRDLRLATGLLAAEQRLRDRHGGALPGPQRVGEVMRHPVHVLRVEATVVAAAKDMLRHGVGAIPVVEAVGAEEHLIGIVTETDLLRAFFEQCRGGAASADEPARAHMHAPLPCVAPELPVEVALQRMDRELRHLGVLQDGKLVGIVSERDLSIGLARTVIRDARARVDAGREEAPSTVAQVMTTRLVTAAPDTPLSTCAARMLDHRVGALPILEGGVPRGLVTQRHVLAHFLAVASGDERRDAEGP